MPVWYATYELTNIDHVTGSAVHRDNEANTMMMQTPITMMKMHPDYIS